MLTILYRVTDGVLDAKARVLGAARLDWIARLAVVEAEQHAPFVLESGKSRHENKVRLYRSCILGVFKDLGSILWEEIPP